MSQYKNRHPDDTDEPQDVGLSLIDDAIGMKEQIGIARRITLPRPSPGRPSAVPGKPSATAGPAGSSGPQTEPPEGFMMLGPDEVIISKGVLQGIKRVCCLPPFHHLLPHPDLLFDVPQLPKHAVHCNFCRKDFPTSKGYHTKQALVQHLKVHHPPASKKECTCPDCKEVFNLVKTMREHWATHMGPFPCPVEDCPTVFTLPKHCNHHLCEKHGLNAKRF